MDILEPIFKPIIDPVKSMIIAIVGIGDLIIELILLLPKFVLLIPHILEPDKLINDIIYGVNTGISTIINVFIDNILNLFSEQNKSTTSNDDGIYGNKVKNICVNPTLVNLIILVLCPPLSIYISKGLSSGFLLIVICAILTYYMYYFPGLLFAALHILC
jgi:uncharacterized membrane protein YqaE (UPF0057 family)